MRYQLSAHGAESGESIKEQVDLKDISNIGKALEMDGSLPFLKGQQKPLIPFEKEQPTY